MATYLSCNLVYINPDGSVVSVFKADDDAVPFLDYGDYLLPFEWGV